MTDLPPDAAVPRDDQYGETETPAEASLMDLIEQEIADEHDDESVPERETIAKVLDALARISTWSRVEVWVNGRGQGFYLPIHRNGEPGPRSEPYESGLWGAKRAARSDFPCIVQVDVTRP